MLTTMSATASSAVFACLLLLAGGGGGSVFSVDAFAPSSAVPSVSSSTTVFGAIHGHGRRMRDPSIAFVPSSSTSTTSSSTTCLFMGWGPEPIWSTATVSTSEDGAPQPACPSGSCVTVTLNVPPETAAEYKVPGQYVQVKADGVDNPLFLAIASPPTGSDDDDGDEADAAAGGAASPTSTEFEFLIKKTDNNAWITDAAPGTTFSISQVLGNGFPLAENLEGFKYDFPTQNVLLFATGSGIAPIRSAIESGQLNVARPGAGGRTARLYYGVRSVDDMPYVERFAAWEAAGVEVVPVMSQPELGQLTWDGRTGYVQNALEEDGVPIPRNSGALMCGVKGMTEAVKETLMKAGVFEGRVLTNF